MNNQYENLKKILASKNPPSYTDFFQICLDASNLLEEEKTVYRPSDNNGNPGGLLDFSELTPLPLILIPDIHARTSFLQNILDFVITKESGFISSEETLTVYEALQKKLIRIVCVGDALHTEGSTIFRWKNIQKEFDENNYTGPLMTAEASDCFNTLFAIMKLKVLFPENFHFLKGNHENIYNKTGNGDFAFKKYSDEGFMLKMFTQHYYGDDILYLISSYENNLPLIYSDSKCVISHAQPKNPYTKSELINARIYDNIVYDLTWTANGQAAENSERTIIQNLNSEIDNSIPYFAGHRPVQNDYNFIKERIFYQIHNPVKQNIVLLFVNKDFSPENDIVNTNPDINN